MAEERQTNYTVMEGYELPSKGLIYDKKVNPHVELRSMTARDEMKRLAPSTTPLKTLADIIEGCMIEKPAIHVYDMALADYEYLLHKLRIVTYGPDYKMVLRCPECGESFETVANLDDLEVKNFDITKFEELKTFQLPKSGKTITLKVLTPRLLDTIESRTKEMQRKYKSAEIDFETKVKLQLCIETIDGNIVSPVDIESIIDNLPALDMQKILSNMDKLNQSFGINNEIFLNCTKCNSEVMTFFRFGPEFFRPSNI